MNHIEMMRRSSTFELRSFDRPKLSPINRATFMSRQRVLHTNNLANYTWRASCVTKRGVIPSRAVVGRYPTRPYRACP